MRIPLASTPKGETSAAQHADAEAVRPQPVPSASATAAPQPAPSAVMPPVVVMNPYYSGVGIARALRGRHVPIVALTSETDIPGARSRCFDRVLNAPNGRDEPEALRDFLLKAADGFPCKPVLFPTRDFDVIFLEQYRDTLAPRYVLPQPDHSPILRMMDKLELAEVATKLGLPDSPHGKLRIRRGT